MEEPCFMLAYLSLPSTAILWGDNPTLDMGRAGRPSYSSTELELGCYLVLFHAQLCSPVCHGFVEAAFSCSGLSWVWIIDPVRIFRPKLEESQLGPVFLGDHISLQGLMAGIYRSLTNPHQQGCARYIPTEKMREQSWGKIDFNSEVE